MRKRATTDSTDFTKISQINKLTEKIIGMAMKVHRELGPGFVEKIYQRALSQEFKDGGLRAESEKRVAVSYKSKLVGYQILDFIVDESVIVEIKAVSELNDIHTAQMISYLKATDKQIGLLLNFATQSLGIKRIINKSA